MALVQNYGSHGLADTTRRPSPNAAATGSRLAQMQARFQQKQLQEKEQKLLQMYENQQQKTIQRVGRGSAGSVSSVSSMSSVSSGGGRVRQMFEERRSNQSPTKTMRSSKNSSTGWDRSYPLEPIETNKGRSRNGWGGGSLNNSMNASRRAAPRGTSLDRSNTIQKNTIRRTRSQQQMNQKEEYEPPVYGRTITRNHQVSRTMPPNGHYRTDANYNNRVNYHQQQQQQHAYQPYQQQQHVYQQQQQQHNNNYHNRYYDYADDDSESEVDVGLSRSFKKLSNVGSSVMYSNNANTYNNNHHAAYSNSNGFSDGGSLDGYNYVEEVEVFPPPPVRSDRRVTPPRDEIDSPPPRPERRFVEERKKPQTEARRWESRRSESKVTPSPTRPARRPLAKNNSQSTPPPSEAAMQRGGPGTVKKTSVAQTSKSSGTSQRGASNSQSQQRRPLAQMPIPDDLLQCKICGRAFAKDRLEKHEEICERTSKKKRKVFDPTKMRVKGTEAESYVRAGARRPEPAKQPQAKKADWRKKHEEFIATIRQAKMVQQHVAAGGKVSDLPPPPPMDTSDYIQCPHCGRKFNEAAADRHIPKCQNIQSNKPRTGAIRKR